ncbi:hypothetical protein E2C01_085463 [Portunus trituberculatus]|uniref:Uncharacterized protein n=1 Tax=Portunus trituberculatus TaxID=210409 RepID=A0A5B7JDP4_PORTR|nr:hypothetical protein [Portunus trituberculatus]
MVVVRERCVALTCDLLVLLALLPVVVRIRSGFRLTSAACVCMCLCVLATVPPPAQCHTHWSRHHSGEEVLAQRVFLGVNFFG